MITLFENFENIENSFTIKDLINYFDEDFDFYDKTHKFLRLNILYKKISIKGKYNNYTNIVPMTITYSPRSAPEFWIDIENIKIIGINKNDIITLEHSMSIDVKNIIKEINIKKNADKYNI